MRNGPDHDCDKRNIYVVICDTNHIAVNQAMVVTVRLSKWWLQLNHYKTLILLVEETGIPGETHRSVKCHWQTLSHNVVSSTHRLSMILTHNYSGDRYWLHRCFKSNYHTITTTTTPFYACHFVDQYNSTVMKKKTYFQILCLIVEEHQCYVHVPRIT